MEIALKIEGMTCGGCKAAVERILNAQPGVTAVDVDLSGGRATITSNGAATPQALATAVEDAGYGASVQG